jgi:tetratricopeptide (TPR) repeat protein
VKQARADTVTAAGPELRPETAHQLWTGRLAPGGEPRAAESRSLSDGAVAELRRNIAATPSDPYLHERLAWVLDLQAAMDSPGSPTLREAALTHMQRAVALQPGSALLRRSLAALFLAAPAAQLDQAIEAGRAAAERDPTLSGSLVEMMAPFRPSDAQWTALAPRNAVDRAELARELEARGFFPEACVLYERALEGASPGDATVIHWMLAELLLRMQRPSEAIAQTETALTLSPRNPELLLVRARALGMAGSPARLDAYREAAASASTRRGPVFTAQSHRLQTVADDRLGNAARVTPARYRSALAQRLTDEQQWGQARDEWKRLKAEGRLDGAGELSLGLALESTGDLDGALEAFRQAVALEPSRTSAHAHLASLLWSREQYMQAIAEWETVTAQQPGDVEAGLALARAYLEVGDRVHALAEYRRLLALSPGLPEAKQAVARLEQKP